jgi:hypothetical protein
LIVLRRSAGPPGRQKDMMRMEPIRPRFGSGGVPPFQVGRGRRNDIDCATAAARRNKPGFALVVGRFETKFLARRQVGSVDLERPGYGRNS